MSEFIKEAPFMEPVKPFINIPHEKGLMADSVHLLGFCFDGTTSFRPGSRFGPDAIRDASYGLEDYSPYLNRSTDERQIVDIGNLPVYPSKWHITNGYFEGLTEEVDIREHNMRFVTLGGEHSISYGPICLYLKHYPDLVLLHLDAHTDLRDGYLEEKYSHASIIRRVLDHFGEGHQLIQYGIRSGPREEFEYMRENKTVRTSLKELCEDLEALPEDRPIYLTLDLDFFDPAYLPGTGTPEAGGEDFHAFVRLMKILSKKNFVGADIVELAPMLDATNNSACFAAKVTREVMLALN